MKHYNRYKNRLYKSAIMTRILLSEIARNEDGIDAIIVGVVALVVGLALLGAYFLFGQSLLNDLFNKATTSVNTINPKF
jgi:Flp pilus assembly pilin Flp